MTDAATKQMKKLEEKLAGLKIEMAKVNEQMNKPSSMWKYLVRERNALYTKIDRCDSSTRVLAQQGMTNAEHKKVAEEVMGANSILEKTESGLGYRERVVVGFSTRVSSYIRVRSTRWNGFMRNVKGCASMADTCDISWERISEEEFTAIKNAGIKHTTAFAGATTTERARPVVAQA